MNNLIKITTSDNDKQFVSARDLHKGLEVKTRFSQWVTQNFKVFRESIDFTSVVSTTVVNNGAVRELQDYSLSVEMAKHISMMTGTAKGFEVRDYFIKVEKAWNNPDMIIKRAMDLQARKIISLETKLEEQKPKVIFADAVSASRTSILIGDFAKLLKQNGLDFGQNRLFGWLRGNGYLISRRGSSWNMPTQKSIDLKLFEIKETTINHSDGHISISKTPKITGKGQLYFAEKLLSDDIA